MADRAHDAANSVWTAALDLASASSEAADEGVGNALPLRQDELGKRVAELAALAGTKWRPADSEWDPKRGGADDVTPLPRPRPLAGR